MPSAELKKHLEELIAGKLDKFEDTFDVEWNLFSTLCLQRSQKCLEKKDEKEVQKFRESFMNGCKTKSEKMAFFLSDKHFTEDVENLFQNLLKDSGLSKENKKSAAVARFSFDLAKQKIENWEKALAKYNTALLYCPYSKDAMNTSDTLLFAKILLKRSELFCLNLKVEDGLLDVEEAFDLLKEIKGNERNLLYCKFLYAKSIYLDLLDYKEYEQKLCTSLIEETVEQFKFNSVLRDKLDKYHSFLTQVFISNKELIKSEFDKREPKVNVNVLKANQKMPGVSSSVEMCLIKNKGRCTRASASIKDGTVLFVEDPIISWIRPTMYKSYCNNCLAKIQNHFMTCFSCVKVKYCSGKCRDEAWARYHSVECQYLECLRFLGYGQLVLRSMLLFDQDQMMNVLVDRSKEESELQVKNEIDNETGDKSTKETSKSATQESSTFTGTATSSTKQLSPRSKFENENFPRNDHWVANGFPAKLDYQAFFSLVGDEKHLGFFQLLSFCYGVVLLGMFARKMKLIDRDDLFYYIFHSALLSHIFKINFNCYSINDHSLGVDRKYNFLTHSIDSAKIGIGVYLSSSIISHSCEYNASKLSLGSRIVIFANQVGFFWSCLACLTY